MPNGSSKHSKPKPAEVAADTKKRLIPRVKSIHDRGWLTFSYVYSQPLDDFPMHPTPTTDPPQFAVQSKDPVDAALDWARHIGHKVPFICAANEKRAGGDWETGVVGYEERLCRRSTLSATLSNVAPESEEENYPIPVEGGIWSPTVVVFRGRHDQYPEYKEREWVDLPVCSVAPMRWPKLNHNGTKYSFAEEREMVKNKLRAALKICIHEGYDNVVIGDWGLGNSYRNPPQELAEMWREVFLWDPEIRGRFRNVLFAFEEQAQSTTRLIQDDLQKKSKSKSGGGGGGGGSSSSSSSKSKSKSKHGSGSSSSSSSDPQDFAIFDSVFRRPEIDRIIYHQPDPRYGFSALMAPTATAFGV